MTTTTRKNNWWLVGGLALLVVVSILAAGRTLPEGIDWRDTFRPAARQIISGQSPYDDLAFYSPPWTGLILLPLAALSVEMGRGAVFVLSLIVYATAAIRLGARPVAVILLLLSPVVMHGLLNANIDWLVLLALFMPARWGLFFALIKPQVGAGLVLFWAVEAWREGRWQSVVSVFWPVTATTALSFVLYGPWPLHARQTLEYWYNASLFPYSVPVGIALLVWAFSKRDERPALAASPMLAPYTLFHSWIGALIALSHNVWLTAVAVGGLWALTALVATTIY